MIFGTLFVVVGAVLIGIFGIVPEPTHSLDDLLRLFGRTSFVVYFTLLAVAVIMILVAVSYAVLVATAGRRAYGPYERPTSQNGITTGTITYPSQ